jgi:hypothetical protein
MAADLAFLTSDASVLARKDEIVAEIPAKRAQVLAVALPDGATLGKKTLR